MFSIFATSICLDIMRSKLFFEFCHFVCWLKKISNHYRIEMSTFQVLEIFAIPNYPSSKTFRDFQHPRQVRTRHTSTHVRTQRRSVSAASSITFNITALRVRKHSVAAASSNTFDITTPSPKTLVESPMAVPKERYDLLPSLRTWRLATLGKVGRLVLHRDILWDTQSHYGRRRV